MTNEEKEIALYCLKATSGYHSEVCEECVKYPICDHTMQDDVIETIIKALEQEPCEDCISRQEAIDAVIDLCRHYTPTKSVNHPHVDFVIEALQELSSVTPKEKTGHRRLTNSEWIVFLVEQFDISRTSAKEMLHVMMSVKKEDNFKKQFSQGKKGFSQGFSQGRK